MSPSPGPAAAPAELEIGNPSRLTPLDLATSRMLGDEPRDPLPRLRRGTPLDETLSDVLEPTLAGGRCIVAFSGGRESSWLLAAATAAARERGHPDPIPATLRYPAPAERVLDQQERVVAHLGLVEWERVEIGDELDLLGTYARRAITDVGVLFPTTAFAFLPLLDLARGGWLLAGGGLTDFFYYWRWARLSDVLARRRRPRRRDGRDLVAAALPSLVRNTLLRARVDVQAPWLREDAARQAEDLLRRAATEVPVGFEAAMRRQRKHRCHNGMKASFDALAASVGARFALPFRDDRYIAAFARAGGRRGFGDRRSTLEHVVGHLLPADLRRSSDGVSSRQAFFGAESRDFVQRWSGGGIDPDLIDTGTLHDAWSSGTFPWASTMLLQLAFAHDEARQTARV